jgi:hypothetical protein
MAVAFSPLAGAFELIVALGKLIFTFVQVNRWKLNIFELLERSTVVYAWFVLFSITFTLLHL